MTATQCQRRVTRRNSAEVRRCPQTQTRFIHLRLVAMTHPDHEIGVWACGRHARYAGQFFVPSAWEMMT